MRIQVTLVSCKVKGPIHRVISLMCVSIDCVPSENTGMVKTRDLHIKMIPSSPWDERLLTGN